MNLNKCERCGCFFTSIDSVCPNCLSKDKNDLAQLTNFLTENDAPISAEDLSLHTGVSLKNVNRFLKDKNINSNLTSLGLINNPIGTNSNWQL